MFAVTVDSRHDLAAAHNDNAVTHAEDLRHFRGDHDNAFALLYQIVHDVVNLDLCANVDAAGRFVKDEDVGVRVDSLADNDLLLVTAGQLADDFVDRRGFDAQRSNVLLAALQDLLFVKEQALAEAPHVCEDQVGADRLRQDKALALTVLGEERNARVNRLTGALDMYLLALDGDRAAISCGDRIAGSLGDDRAAVDGDAADE